MAHPAVLHKSETWILVTQQLKLQRLQTWNDFVGHWLVVHFIQYHYAEPKRLECIPDHYRINGYEPVSRMG